MVGGKTMDSKNGVICYKIVTSKQVNVDNIVLPEVSEAVRQVIREAKLESMNGLLGRNWKDAVHKLAREYWGINNK
jgi:hypothetical protein